MKLSEMSDAGLVSAYVAAVQERNRLSRELMRVEKEMAAVLAEVHQRSVEVPK